MTGSYLFPWLQVSLPVLELLGVGLVQLLQLRRLVLHEHFSLLVLKLKSGSHEDNIKRIHSISVSVGKKRDDYNIVNTCSSSLTAA